MEERIIGHKKILSFFGKVIKNEKLSHAYCFVGPEAVGKRTVAEEIASGLLSTVREKLNAHLDFISVKQEFIEKTEKTNKDINVKQIRDLRQYLARHACQGGYKVAIIDEAEKMNAEAANALLKTLEEPTAKTVLFLITKDESLLPATIISRCQTIYFFSVAREEITAVFKNEKQEIARWSLGLPGRLLKWQADPDSLLVYQKELERFKNLFNKSFFEKLQAVEDLFKDSADSIAGREKLQTVLNIWQLLIRDNYLQHLNLPDLAVHAEVSFPRDCGKNLEKKIQEAKGLLAQNINPRLIFENILLILP